MYVSRGTLPRLFLRRLRSLPLKLSRSLVFVTLLLVSCSDGAQEEAAQETISREAFAKAYIDLRMNALQAEGQEMTLAMRNQVLDSLGLEEEDLIHFVEVHGTDVQFMRNLWEEIDSILDARRRPESVGEASGPS